VTNPIHSNRNREKGYTITEMAIVLLIISIMIGMTLPAIIPLMRGRRLRDAASTLSAAIQATRFYAMSTRQQQTLVLIQVTPADLTDPPLRIRYNNLNGAELTTLIEPNAYLETFSADGTIQPSQLPDLVYIDTVRVLDRATSENSIEQASGMMGDLSNPASIILTLNSIRTADNKTFQTSPTSPNVQVGYEVVTFNPDGGVVTAIGTGDTTNKRYRSIWLVDYRSAGTANAWNTADQDTRTNGPLKGSKRDIVRAWRRKVIRINRLTGRVKIIDPDTDPDDEEALMP